jgi:tRNA pseudouridine55 synthase
MGYLSRSTKRYDATIRLGMSTVTDDADGEALVTVDASHLDDVRSMQPSTTSSGPWSRYLPPCRPSR